jgi:hypothetical protein
MRKYVAKVMQTGQDHPVASVLLNTLNGVPVWTRIEPGRYLCTLAGAFPAEYTVLPTPYMDDLHESNCGFRLARINDDQIMLQQSDVAGAQGGTAFDGFATPCDVVIDIYTNE